MRSLAACENVLGTVGVVEWYHAVPGSILLVSNEWRGIPPSLGVAALHSAAVGVQLGVPALTTEVETVGIV